MQRGGQGVRRQVPNPVWGALAGKGDSAPQAGSWLCGLGVGRRGRPAAGSCIHHEGEVPGLLEVGVNSGWEWRVGGS